MQPFEDSLDETGTYDTGICGEKRIILHSDTPKFLTVQLDDGDRRLHHRALQVKNNELAVSPFSIYYDHYLSAEADAGVYEIKYQVVFVEYNDVMAFSALEGSFIFELESTCTEAHLVEN